MADDVERTRDLIKYIARSLVDDEDAVDVAAIDGDRNVVFELSVAPDDLGKVIGRDGGTARATRTLMNVTAADSRKRFLLDILED